MNDQDERMMELEAEEARQSIALSADARHVDWSIGVMEGRLVTVAVRALRSDGTLLAVKISSKAIEAIGAEERMRLERERDEARAERDDAQGWLAWVTDRINEAARDAHVAEVEHTPSGEAWRIDVKHTLRHLAHKEAERYAAVRRGDEARAEVERLRAAGLRGQDLLDNEIAECGRVRKERNDAQAEVERLKAEGEPWKNGWRVAVKQRNEAWTDLSAAVAREGVAEAERDAAVARAERAEDRIKVAEDLLQRVVIHGGCGAWTWREMYDWCCNYSIWKNGGGRAQHRKRHDLCRHRKRPGHPPSIGAGDSDEEIPSLFGPQGLDAARARVAELEGQKDGAYRERDTLVAALSKVFPSSIERHPDADVEWEDDWRTIIAVNLPTGQATWHIHDSEREMFTHLRPDPGFAWDGHTTEEKYERVRALAAREEKP